MFQVTKNIFNIIVKCSFYTEAKIATHLHVHMLGARGVHGQVGEVDVGLQRGRQLHLCLLCRLPHPLERHVVLGEVDALVALELAHKVVEQVVVKVLPAEEGVSVGRLDLEDSLLDLQDGNVEGASAQIKDGDPALLMGV